MASTSAAFVRRPPAPSSKARRLLLFDIDGTLVAGNSAGRLAMKAALNKLFGTAGPIDDYAFGGKTDAGIIADLLLLAGVAQAEIASNLHLIYDEMAAQARRIYPGMTLQPCDGVPELLLALQAETHLVLGLLTGNAHTTAPLKLAAAGIDPALFVVGAFGSESPNRNDLPLAACRLAATLTGAHFLGQDLVIIGDTVADIECARSAGATAVAVATGWTSREALTGSQPDHILTSLAETAAVLDILAG